VPQKHALIVWGGWEGHEPQQVAQLFSEMLSEENWRVETENSLEIFRNETKLNALNLIIPIWTMGEIEQQQLAPVLNVVSERGVGLAGCHGGMCDAFRNATEWQFMTGGQWVAHPGGDNVNYRVKIKQPNHPIVKDIPDFDVRSEQYYMHVDPAVEVLAITTFPTEGVPGPHETNGPTEMPVVWTKYYGKGRVFYCSLGHKRSVVEQEPVRTLLKRGLLWAAKEISPNER
jgi:type 1 glutamine amidotransferase